MADSIQLTAISDITDKVDKTISDFSEALENLNEASIDFINKYDNYLDSSLYDSTLLKKRMKAAVIKAINDDTIQ